MGVEVGGDDHLRNVEFALSPQRGDDLGRQEVRVDDEVPRFGLQEADEAAQVEPFQGEAESVGARDGRAAGAIEEIVEVAVNVGARFIRPR